MGSLNIRLVNREIAPRGVVVVVPEHHPDHFQVFPAAQHGCGKLVPQLMRMKLLQSHIQLNPAEHRLDSVGLQVKQRLVIDAANG